MLDMKQKNLKRVLRSKMIYMMQVQNGEKIIYDGIMNEL